MGYKSTSLKMILRLLNIPSQCKRVHVDNERVMLSNDTVSQQNPNTWSLHVHKENHSRGHGEDSES